MSTIAAFALGLSLLPIAFAIALVITSTLDVMRYNNTRPKPVKAIGYPRAGLPPRHRNKSTANLKLIKGGK